MDITTPTNPRAPVRNGSPAPTATVVGPRTTAHCPKCQASVARDQRYCVDCGQRLGEARPPLLREGGIRAAAIAPVPVQATAAAAPATERARLSQTSLIAGVGTLILAMGVGVLIGKGNTPAAPTAVVAGGLAPTTANVAAATTPDAAATDTAAGAADSKATKSDAAKEDKVAKAAKAAGGTVISSNDGKPLPKKVTVGSKGSGKGYEDGEFTGNFFGP